LKVPLYRFYLGQLTSEEAATAAPGPDQRCETAYYRGALLAAEGKATEARPLLDEAIQTCPVNFIEDAAAPVEIARLGQ
jgi:hypothetical protein